MVSSQPELLTSDNQSFLYDLPQGEAAFHSTVHRNELNVWLLALGSFFRVHNHNSFFDSEELIRRDWRRELLIAQGALLNCSRLALPSLAFNKTESIIFDNPESVVIAETLTPADQSLTIGAEGCSSSFVSLNEFLSDANALCDSLLAGGAVSLLEWVSLGDYFTLRFKNLRDWESDARFSEEEVPVNLREVFLQVTQEITEPVSLAADLRQIFLALVRMLNYLPLIENYLRRDQPLKQTLPLFALIYDEARALIDFIEARALRNLEVEQVVAEVLDRTNYAISMELRKVFSSELDGLGAMRNASGIYSRVECAHGLLRNSFQQSIISLAQVFIPTLDGAQLFSNFQTRFEQSLILRGDLWRLLQLVKRVEKEQEQFPVEVLINALAAFREGSMRNLMYKDWESCERFIEEISCARGAVRLAQVCHRFGAYLEALFSQINMRAVLAAHPFDYSAA